MRLLTIPLCIGKRAPPPQSWMSVHQQACLQFCTVLRRTRGLRRGSVRQADNLFSFDWVGRFVEKWVWKLKRVWLTHHVDSPQFVKHLSISGNVGRLKKIPDAFWRAWGRSCNSAILGKWEEMGLLGQGKLENTLAQFSPGPHSAQYGLVTSNYGLHISGDYLWETRDLKTIPKSKWTWGNTFNNGTCKSWIGRE